MKKITLIYIILSFLLFAPKDVYTQWSNDPNFNLQITNWGDAPIGVVSDAKGGAFISAGMNKLIDYPPWAVKHPFLLWIDKYGNHNLDTGYKLGGNGDYVWKTILTEDGKGEYFAIFIDKILEFVYEATPIYNDKIVVQKFDSLGNKLWGDGVYVTLDTTDNIGYEYALDGNGGCYISWNATDQWGVSHGRQVVQHLSREGQRLWSDSGKVLCINPFYQDNYPLKIISNGDNGIYARYSPQNNKQYLYANLDYNGNILWQVPSRITSAYSDDVNLTSDSSGNLFCIGFSTPENSLTTYLRFESVSPTGNYSSDLMTLIESNASSTRIWNFSSQDSILIFTFAERSSSSEYINYFQILDKNGNARFNNKGIVPFNSGWFLNKKLINSGEDFILTCNNEAQKLNIGGQFLWGEKPITFTKRRMGNFDFTSDGFGGFIVLWSDIDVVGIFGQQVNVKGELGVVMTSVDYKTLNTEKEFCLLQNYPNPFNSSTNIKYTIPTDGFVKLKIYDVTGNEISTIENCFKRGGTYDLTYSISNISTGVYFCTIMFTSEKFCDQFHQTRKMIYLK